MKGKPILSVKKTPMRTCVVSREVCPKDELLRIVVNKAGEVNIDTTGKMNGRGAYILLSKENLEKSKKKKVLEKVLRVNDLTDLYIELEEMCNE